MDKSDQKVIDDVEKYGVHITHVLESDEYPEFSYTTGFYKSYKHPEIIIAGLKRDLCHDLLNDLNHDIKNGKEYFSGQFYDGILDNFPCYFGTTFPDNKAFWPGVTMWYYNRKDFPLLQCVAPTTKGIFPWEENFPEDARFYFPLLVEPPKK